MSVTCPRSLFCMAQSSPPTFLSGYVTFSLATEHGITMTEPNTFHQVDRQRWQENILPLLEAEVLAKLSGTEIAAHTNQVTSMVNLILTSAPDFKLSLNSLAGCQSGRQGSCPSSGAATPPAPTNSSNNSPGNCVCRLNCDLLSPQNPVHVMEAILGHRLEKRPLGGDQAWM